MSFTTVIILTILAAYIMMGLAIYGWLQRSAGQWTLPFVAICWGATIWLFAYSLEIITTELGVATWMAKIEYLGIATIPLAWFILSLFYTNPSFSLTRNWIILLSLIPAITILLVFTNEWHGFIWRSLSVEDNGSFSVLAPEYGFWFQIHFVYSYLLLLLGTLIMFRAIFMKRKAQRWLSLLMVFGPIFPWLGNIIYLSDVNPVPLLDWTPLGFAISGMIYAIAAFGLGLFDPLSENLNELPKA
ncbi:MAG: hypothetical protein DWQ07_00830 [Chloroflexi bacterium]|nr:MAG: hypothetical protein DWQ07_00830 [Chloroflexota bacterium]MBL1195877.1 hypothetical protein [Chloroflexota bacterium]NOH13169.1 hypothetical protein [Chloroflexota bacterium]